MRDQPNPTLASTTEAGAAQVASRAGAPSAGRRGRDRVPCEGEGKTFEIAPSVERGASGRPYERTPDDPLYRPLRIYTVDPGVRQDQGATAVVNVPYEPLDLPRRKGARAKKKEGIKGSLFHVMPILKHPDREDSSEEDDDLDLNEPFLLLTDGHAPSPVDPRFHQQMVYAVASLVYASFQRALGRHVTWAHGGARLQLYPHGRRGHAGADYARESGAVNFGFVRTEHRIEGRACPDGHTFSCVSHDIVTHEVTHALLDGLRAHFLEPTSPDVLGFHEGFADVIALLHHFSYKEVVRAVMRRHCGDVLESELITAIAMEFGHATGLGGAIRSFHDTRAKLKAALANAVMPGTGTANAKSREADPAGPQPAAPDQDAEPNDEEEPVVLTYRPDMDAHEMGQVFSSAVLYAFATVYARKTRRYRRLATGGTGVLPRGDISADLQDVLAEEASQLASQFLNVCIRAIDYCPPVDLQLGEFLRAVITADLDLVPDDPWGYREAWIDAFALHRIYPRGVQSMSEDQLKWEFNPSREKREKLEKLVVKELSFTKLKFNGDPACAPGPDELRERACALGKFVAAHPERFGMVAKDDQVDLPVVQSVRTSRRVGPNGQVVFDLVAEVTQTRWVQEDDIKFLFRGGCTVILGPRGEVRYVISKSVTQNSRVFRQKKFMLGRGAVHVIERNGWKVPDAETVQFDHHHRQRDRHR